MATECRSNRRGDKHTDDCVPWDYDAQGWPLGMRCSNEGCGAWICQAVAHSKKFIGSKNRAFFYCRSCVDAGLIPKRFQGK